MAIVLKKPVSSRHHPNGRTAKNITMGPRALKLVERAAEAACTSHSAVIEQLILAHCEKLIEKEQAALAST
jgi:hypothetical protein